MKRFLTVTLLALAALAASPPTPVQVAVRPIVATSLPCHGIRVVGWHFAEWGSQGVGTGSAVFRFWVNGSLVDQQSVPLAGRKLTDLVFPTSVCAPLDATISARADLPDGSNNAMGLPVVEFPDNTVVVGRHRAVNH